MTEYSNILIVQLRQLGDILLTTPVVDALRDLYPSAKISFLAHPMGKLVLNGNPNINELLFYPSSNVEYARFLWDLRKKKYDLVLDFMFNGRSAIFSRITGAEKRLSFYSRRSFFYTDTIARNVDTPMYIVDEKLRLLKELSWSGSRKNITLSWYENDIKVSKEFLKSISQDKVRVVISATHRRSNRQWPLERYAQLSDWLVSNFNAEVIWLWGPGEEEFVDSAMKGCHQIAHKAPKTGFREMAALIAQTDLFIGNSNGPSHVAVSCNTPSIQLHGPTSLVSWCPRDQLHRGLWGGSLDSSMTDIDFDDVVKLIQEMESVILKAQSSRQKVGYFRNYKDTVERTIKS